MSISYTRLIDINIILVLRKQYMLKTYYEEGTYRYITESHNVNL